MLGGNKLFAKMAGLLKLFAEMHLAGDDLQLCLTVASHPDDRMLRMFHVGVCQ